jgi:hypothetical protein
MKLAAVPDDPFSSLKALVLKMNDRSYAAGFRKATNIVVNAVGQLDADVRDKFISMLHILEEELHKAEEAAK